MRVAAFARYLETCGYTAGSVSSRSARASRIEGAFGDLDTHYRRDRLAAVIDALAYSADDAAAGKPAPSGIGISGNLVTGLASLKAAARTYRNFRDAADAREPGAA